MKQPSAQRIGHNICITRKRVVQWNSLESNYTLWEVKPFQVQEHQENTEKLNKLGN